MQLAGRVAVLHVWERTQARGPTGQRPQGSPAVWLAAPPERLPPFAVHHPPAAAAATARPAVIEILTAVVPDRPRISSTANKAAPIVHGTPGWVGGRAAGCGT
jgi:hypothetical protein